MSQENVEVVRRFIDQYGDAPSDLQGLAANFFEPDADYYRCRSFPRHGHVTASRRSPASRPTTGMLGTATRWRSTS
jgi:hypothetical protein